MARVKIDKAKNLQAMGMFELKKKMLLLGRYYSVKFRIEKTIT